MTTPAQPAAPSPSPTADAATGVPPRAGAVLATLIIIAAVANLPLAMANIALPSIGTAFDASQTQLNLVAVAYSLGLACSVLWLGALGDRYGRKQIAIVGVSLAIPAALLSRVRRLHRDPHLRPPVRRLRRGHGLPDDPRPHRGAVGTRPGPHQGDRPVGGGRRRDLGLRAAAVGDHPQHRRLAVGVLHRHPARPRRAVPRDAQRAVARERGRPRPSTTSAASCR